MMDEFEAINGYKAPGFITGKPVDNGGSLGRTEATGYGVMYTVREALKQLNIDPATTKASFQGLDTYMVAGWKAYRLLVE